MNIVIDYLNGNCPVQAEGTVGGKPFYFRARGSRWSLSIGGEPVGSPEWYYEQPYGKTEFAAGYMEQHEALRFIAKGVKLYSKQLSKTTLQESSDTLALLLAEEKLYSKQKENTMTYDDIDNLVKRELQGSIRSLCDTILQYDPDYEDSVITLDGMITALDYYSPRSEFAAFIATIPEAILDILNPPETLVERMGDGICIATTSDSPLAQNLQNLGFQTHMALADLGFITLETLINAAKLQLQGNGTKV